VKIISYLFGAISCKKIEVYKNVYIEFRGEEEELLRFGAIPISGRGGGDEQEEAFAGVRGSHEEGMVLFASGVILSNTCVVKSSGGIETSDSDHSYLEASVVKQVDSSRVVGLEKRPQKPGRKLANSRQEPLNHVEVGMKRR
jgi:hypothetical protein